jgi:hypothetical protein
MFAEETDAAFGHPNRKQVVYTDFTRSSPHFRKAPENGQK